MKTNLTLSDVVDLFSAWADEFSRQREELIQLDQQVGDGDLGITMQKAYRAAALLRSDKTKGIEHHFIQCGLAMAKSAPSTMGTLMATGFMRGGKALPINTCELDVNSLAIFFKAFTAGIAERGKAQPGDKTVLDVLLPAEEALTREATNNSTLAQAVYAGFVAAEHGLEQTRHMVPRHGKAAVFAHSSKGLVDPGGAGALIIFKVLNTFIRS